MTYRAVPLAALAALALLAACSTSSRDDAGTDDAAMSDLGAAADGGDGGEPDAAPVPPSMPAGGEASSWVDPFIGTGGLGYDIGNSYPGPQRPFGMAKPGPDTVMAGGGAPGFYHCSGYYYPDDTITGFSHTRLQGTGVVEYGVPAVMPTVGFDATKTGWAGYASHFSHGTETARPGYYAVTLDTTNVRVELTATDRVGVHRWTFPAGSDAVALFDMAHVPARPDGGDVTIVDARVTVDATAGEVHGFVHYSGGYSGRFGGLPVFFVARFDHPIARHGVWKAGVVADGEDERTGGDAGAYVAFDTTGSGGAVVEAAVAISFVDEAHARMNLDAEQPTIDFDATAADAHDAWEHVLSRVAIEGRSQSDFRKFYTALYHTLLMPTLASDVDGSYRGMDTNVHVMIDGPYYTDFSLWDTFRSEHPFLTLVYPEYQRDFLRSLVQMGRDGGYIDRWPLGDGYTEGMVGESADVVFADSWAKGLRDFDLRSAYTTLRGTAMASPPPGAPYGGRGGLAGYLAHGYVDGEASVTLEYAYDDWALARIAEALGESADRAMFDERARAYAHLYDPATGYLRGRNADGTFPTAAGFDPRHMTEDYVEGNAYQYTWYAPHDMDGLCALMGGRGPCLARLESLFQMTAAARHTAGPDTFYWQGNEPDIHYPWAFAMLGQPEGTQRWTRWVVAHRFTADVGEFGNGLPGNDDAGTMSAWLVFAMSGFYTIAGTDTYILGSPTLTHVTMHLAHGDLVIDAPDASDASPYVQSATLDGAPLDVAHFSQADVDDGGATIHLVMGPSPSTWGTTSP